MPRDIKRGYFIRGGAYPAVPPSRPNIPRPVTNKSMVRKGAYMFGGVCGPNSTDVDDDQPFERQQKQTAALTQQVNDLLERVRQVRAMIK